MSLLTCTHSSRNYRRAQFLTFVWSIGLACGAAVHAQDVSKLPAGEGLEQKGFTVKKSGNVTNIEADGNLGPNSPFTGSSLDEITPENNPVDIGRRAVALFQSDRASAHRLVLAAQLLAKFDIARVSDLSAHQAYGALFETGVLKDIAYWGTFKPEMQKEDLFAVADWAKRTGPPSYPPRWMIQHGTAVLQSAIAGTDPGSGLIADFDAGRAWREGYEKLYAFVGDEANWEERRRNATPEAITKWIEFLFREASEGFKKQYPDDVERLKADLRKMFASVDPKSEEAGIQILSAKTALERYMKQFREEQNTPLATKVDGKPGWIKSPYNGRVLDATGLQPGQLVIEPGTEKVMRVPK